jgi:NMD protein affecting ribosome stability and mRNA decay
MKNPRTDSKKPARRPADPYKAEQKLADGTTCPACDLRFRAGRWVRPQQGEEPGSNSTLCPACKRIRDRYPAGVLDVRGDLQTLGPELVNLIRNVEEVEGAEHPLERIMHLEQTADRLSLTTTGVHLTRRVGAALERQLGDRVQIRYGEEENLVRVDVVL